MADGYTLADYRIDLYRIQKWGLNPRLAGVATGVYDRVPLDDWAATVACLARLLDAMTPEERQSPDRIGPEEMQRLAATTGTAPEEVERALKHFQHVPDAMRRLTELRLDERIKFLCGLA